MKFQRNLDAHIFLVACVCFLFGLVPSGQTVEEQFGQTLIKEESLIYPKPNERNEDADFWLAEGRRELEVAKARALALGLRELRRPKNVVLFVGDGMGLNTVTAARIYKGQSRQGVSGEEASLAWERFPSMGLLKTYAVDAQVTDSAAAATGLFSGVKTNHDVVGFDSSAEYENIEQHVGGGARKVDSILKWAQDVGMRTGFVTDKPVTDATPAALYAHSTSRKWECDAKMPVNDLNASDIARQLVESSVGRGAEVILGGGRAALRRDPTLPKESWDCNRADGRDLVEEWAAAQGGMGRRGKYVGSAQELAAVDVDNVDSLLGLFASGALRYSDEEDRAGEPQLPEMVETAIKMLGKDSAGFLLVVEGGAIDHAHHNTRIKTALEETVELDEAVRAALDAVAEDTLVIVTADHSHTLAINGFSHRGSDVTGLATARDEYFGKDPYDVLSYATGPTDPDVPWSGVHGGSDVGVWATGPLSYLFHSVHEQTHVAHVVAYAMCAGPYREDACAVGSAGLRTTHSLVSELLIAASIFHLASY